MTTDTAKARAPEGAAIGRKRRQIIDGAGRVFLAQGFDAASMGAIAREAGVSKGTLYVYFKSKEELFEAIVEDQCRPQAEQIFTFDREAPIASELHRVGEGLRAFSAAPTACRRCAPSSPSPIACPRWGQILCLGTGPRHCQPAALSGGQGRRRGAGATRQRGRRRPVHRRLRFNHLQADVVQRRRSAAGDADRPCGGHGREGLPCDLPKAGSGR